MNQTIRNKLAFGFRCREMLHEFLARFPNEQFCSAALESLRNLLAQRDYYPGDPGGWAGGLVYMIASHDPRVPHPLFHNSDLEAVFRVSMGTIRKRADKLWQVVFPEVFTD